MGQIFQPGGLTQPNTALMSQNNAPEMIGKPQDVLNQFYKQGAQSNASLNPGPANFTGPHVGTPSYAEAASAGATPGGANATSPGLNKAGKLMTILSSGLQGALAGRAANEQATVQSGGRRSGGAGMAFQAGYELPWERQQRLNQLAQQQAQTGVLQSEAQTFNIPGVGQIPGWLAKTMGPAFLRQQGQLGSAQIGAQGRVAAAGTAKPFMAVPGVGLFDTRAGAVIPGTSKNVTITPEIASQYQLPQDFIGKPMDVGQLATLERAQSYQDVIAQGENGPSLVNRNPASPQFGQARNLGIGAPAMSGITQVGDVNNPGQTLIVPKTQAIGKPGVQSASVAVPKKAQEAAVPTNIGNQKVAFNTMLQHADLLQKAITALNNGDQRTLNSIKNAFKTQFGSSDVTNFEAIANAYNHEVTSVIAKGHMTDAEVRESGAILPPNASPQQIIGALNTYRALAQSKMNMLDQQTRQAVGASQGGKSSDPLGIR